MQRRRMLLGITGIITPILVYYILIAFLQMVLGAVFPKLLLAENTMWLLTAANALMFPVLWWMYQKDEIWRNPWLEKKKPLGIVGVILVIAGAVCISRGANLLIGLTPLPYLFPQYESVTQVIYGGSLLSRIAASVISASILEELLMRGLVYGRLRRVTGNVKISMVASALAFGVFHGNVVQGVYAFVLGLFFVQLYERSGNLWLPVLAHMAANATSILLEEFTWLNEMAQSLTGYYLQTAFFLLVGMLVWRWLWEAVKSC